jgi:glycosyltransferase involved in cell wall biosynthesis
MLKSRLIEIWTNYYSKHHPRHSVVLCTWGLAPGGAERQWVYLAKALANRGIAVTLITYEPLVGPNAQYLPLLSGSNVRFMDASRLEPTAPAKIRRVLYPLADKLGLGEREIQNILRLVAAFRILSPTVVYSQLDEPNIFAGIAARLCGIRRFVMSFRSYNPTHFDWILLPWMLPSYRWLADWDAIRYTGNGAVGNKSYADWIGLSADKVILIPNTIGNFNLHIPTPEGIDAARHELGLQHSDHVLIGVFRLSDEKDPRTFLLVCRELMRQFSTLRALIVGNGKMREELLAFTQELKIQHRISFLGYRSDVNVLMSLSTLLLHTSIREGMSNVVVEAQALGLPVVATEIAGISDVVRNPESALLCPPGDVECLAEACRSLLSNPGLRCKMGNAGKQFVYEHFGEDAFVSRYIEIGLGRMDDIGARRLRSKATRLCFRHSSRALKERFYYWKAHFGKKW